jgi:exopolysaccharide biosynthesis polyprenyl glycosylphosphotransferase
MIEKTMPTKEGISTKDLSAAVAQRERLSTGGSAHLRDGRGVAVLLFLTDLVVTVLAYLEVVALRQFMLVPSSFDWITLAMVVLMQFVSMSVVGAYGRATNFRTISYACQHMLSFLGAFVMVVVVVYYILQRNFMPSRGTLLATMVTVSIATLFIRRVMALARRSGGHFLLVVGQRDDTDHMVQWLDDIHMRYILFYVDPETGLVNGSNNERKDLNGSTIERALELIGRDLEAVILTCRPENLSFAIQNELVALNFNVMPVYTVESFYARNWQVVPLSTLSAAWAFTEGFNLSQNQAYSRLKRAEDVVLSASALVLLSPVFALVWLLVKMGDKGPAIFQQTRVGLMGRKFTLYKFRSMRVGSEKGCLYTQKDDPRITRVGRFLRATRLDELPQLFNVLRGEMSLIGPRAEWDKLVDDYEKQIPYYNLRHLVKPGVTGWAQVRYRYGCGVEDARIKLRYDLYYVKHFSFMLDLSILFKTVQVMIFGKGR